MLYRGKIIIFLCVAVFSCFSLQLSAQSVKADEFFKNGEYSNAKELYLVDYNKGRIDKYSLANLGFCYIAEYNYQKAEAIFSEVVEKKIEPEYLFYYAEILRINEKYDLAKEYYQKSSSIFIDNRYILDQRLASCDSLKKWANFTSPIIVENATKLNTAGADFCALKNGENIFFVSERNLASVKEKKAETLELEDSWKEQSISFLYYTSYSNPEKISPFSISEEFEYSMFTIDENNTIYYTAKKLKTSWEEKEQDFQIYTAKFNQESKAISNEKVLSFKETKAIPSFAQAYVNKEGNEMIFASNSITPSFGGSDLYYSKKENGEWGKPQNLGEQINSPGDEMYPYMYEDTLFFSSNGHPGYGGLDIYYAVKRDNNIWTKPLNLKHPINSRGNDFAYNYSEHPKGFFTSNRSNQGKGGDDIYTFRFPEKDTVVPPPPKEERFCAEAYGGRAIFFDFQQAELKQSSKLIIQEIADSLKKYDDLFLNIVSYSDIRGNEEFNMDLCNKRSLAVKSMFLEKGVKAKQLKIDNKGKTDIRISPYANYALQIGFIKEADKAEYYATKYQLKMEEITVYPSRNGNAYTIGNFQSPKEAAAFANNFNQRFNIGAFPVIIANGELLSDTRFALSRFSELILHY